ncbi:MAG: hypothetical protein SFV19_17745 [Rhodospirillaceae bacterium]|nr:hypothetical protein [Rhodospirillaceae bacterium]
MRKTELTRRQRVQSLFTTATEVLENTHPVATSGQSIKLSRDQYARKARVLLAAAQNLSVAAKAIISETKQKSWR